jgi:adenylate cyclase
MQVYEEFIHLLGGVSPSRAANLPRDKDTVINTRGVENVIRDIRDIFQNEPLIAERMLKELRNGRILSAEPKKIQILKSLIKMYQSANSAYLNFYGPPGTITTIHYYQVLDPQGKETSKQNQFDLSGKAVFVGLSERSPLDQKDGFNTVFSESSGLDISGVEIAATAFANLLEDRLFILSFWAHLACFALGSSGGYGLLSIPHFHRHTRYPGIDVALFHRCSLSIQDRWQLYPFVLLY